MSDHLTPTITQRGFAHLPPIETDRDQIVKAYESSSAEGPHVWLAITDPVGGSEAHAHLSADQAWQLAEQLQHLVRNHYQGDATPECAEEA